METAVAENYDTNPAFAQGGNLDIPAFGGPMGIRWDEGARVTPWGGFAYFATFLRTSGLFDRLVADAPFEYASPNAPAVRDVVGTAVLAILAGFTRYCHVERLRNDTACAALLGLTKVVSDESLRRGLKRCEEARLDAWLSRHERESYEPLLQHDYVMDIDNTVKCVFGRQEGAEVGYKWNVFCRLAEGGRHMEAITSRPMLMGIVGRIVASGRKRYMHLTSTHADAPAIRESLERIGTFLGAISATAPQLGFNRTWTLILKVAFRKWLGGKPLDPLFDGDQMLLRLSG